MSGSIASTPALADYRHIPKDGAPYSAQSGDHVLRGGAWSHNAAICRSAYRDSMRPDTVGWQGRVGMQGRLRGLAWRLFGAGAMPRKHLRSAAHGVAEGVVEADSGLSPLVGFAVRPEHAPTHQPAMRLIREIQRAYDRLVAARLPGERVERTQVGVGAASRPLAPPHRAPPCSASSPGC